MQHSNLLKALVVAALVLSAPERASAWCAEDPLTNTSGNVLRTVPVYLNATSTQTTFLGRPIGEIEQALRAATNAWWEEAGADVRIYYAGRTTSTSTTGRVVVRSDSSTSCTRCTTSGGSPAACENTAFTSGERRGSTVWFEAPATCNPPGAWSTIPRIWTTAGFRQVLTHELGHSLGLNHPQGGQTCPGGGWTDVNLEATMMGIYHWLTIRPDDRAGMTYMYDERCRRLERLAANSTMTSWSSQASYNDCAQARPQGAGLWQTGVSTVGFRNGFVAAVATDDDTSLSIDYPFPFETSAQPVAIARGTTESDMIAVYTDSSTEEDGFFHCSLLTIAVTRNGGASWTKNNPSDEQCTDHAPTIAFDYATSLYVVFMDGVSVHSYMSLDLDGNVVFDDTVLGDKMNSVHSRAAACALTLTFDSNRCLMLYDRNDTYSCLTTRTFRVLTSPLGKLAYGAEGGSCFAQEHTPAVAWWNDLTYSWAMLFKQDSVLFSMVKAYSGTNWTLTRVVANDPTNGITSGALSQRDMDGSANDMFAYLVRLP